MLFDKKGDGKVPVEELGSLLRALNRAPTQSDIDRISRAVGYCTRYRTKTFLT